MWDRPPTHEQLSLKPTPATPSPCQCTFLGSGRASCTSIGHSVGASEPVPTPRSLTACASVGTQHGWVALLACAICMSVTNLTRKFSNPKPRAKFKRFCTMYIYSSYGFCFMAAFSAFAGFSMQPLSSRMAWVHTGGNRPHFRAGSRLLGILKTSKYSSAQTASLLNLYIFTKQLATM